MQLEAFSPDALLTILEEAILSRFDLRVYHEVLDAEKILRQSLLERLSG